ncbi:hypothetical protein ACYPKM_04025 [Pseudomonas aeruginosa]
MSIDEEKVEAAFERFEEDVLDKGEEVDPDDAKDWNDLAFGYALGAGLNLEEAEAFTQMYRDSFD